MLNSWFTGALASLHDSWVKSWQSTVTALLLSAALLLVNYTTTWLSSVQGPWVPVAALLVTFIGGMLKSAQVKEAAALAKKAALLAALLLAFFFAAPASAGPGVFCLSGCDQAGKMKGVEDVQLSATVWAGPGLGAAPAIYNGATKEWSLTASPVLAYGLWYRPAGWTATKSLVGVNLSLFGEIVGVPQAHLDPVFTVNLMDNLQIGGGIRARFAAPGLAGGLDPLFAVFWTTSVGGP